MNQNPTIHATHSCAAGVPGIAVPNVGTWQFVSDNMILDFRAQQLMSGNTIPDFGIRQPAFVCQIPECRTQKAMSGDAIPEFGIGQPVSGDACR